MLKNFSEFELQFNSATNICENCINSESKTCILASKNGNIKSCNYIEEGFQLLGEKPKTIITKCHKFEKLDIESTDKIIQIKDGKITLLTDYKNLNSTHLCFNCSNAYISKCIKVRDREKKQINEYRFIIEGYQVLKEDNFVKKMIVSDCKRFIKD